MRRGHGSLYDIAVPGYKANLSDVLAAIALCQLDKVERHREIRMRQVELYDAAVAELDGIEPLARDPRDTHALHLYVVRVDRSGRARRATSTSGARRREHRHERPLPAGAPAERLPRALPGPAAAAGRRAGRRARCSRCRSRPRTRRRTSRTRSRRSAACTPPSRHEAAASVRVVCDARRHRPLHRVHRLEDRPRRDARHPRATPTSAYFFGAVGDHGRDRRCRWPGAGSSCSPAAGSTTASAG